MSLNNFSKESKHRELARYGYRICEMCQESYKVASVATQRFCGSYKKREGCSWLNHKAKAAESDKKYRLADPERHRERMRRYLKKDPSRSSTNSKRFYRNHRDEILLKQRNDEKRKIYQKKYRNSEKGKKRRDDFLKRNPDYYPRIKK